MNEEQFLKTRDFWGGEIKRGNLIYPNENVIRFIKRNYKMESITILDFGCGGGRNTIALLNEGYRVIAVDYTDEAIEMTSEKVKKLGLQNFCVIKNQGFEVPLEYDSVDAVIADGSLFYNPREDIVKIVANLRTVMRDNALLWADFRTRKDSLYGEGKSLDNGFFVLDDGTGRSRCSYYFADEEDIRYIFEKAGLEVVSLDEYSYTENSGKRLNSWYHVVARK